MLVNTLPANTHVASTFTSFNGGFAVTNVIVVRFVTVATFVEVFGLGKGKTTRSVTQGSGRAAQILRILGLKNLDPDARKTGKRAA